ncbi:tRNA pseudouridine(55) synthase TruB [Pseudalkalibacillus caeni]|uniref:tRNA pseudouridine synthase B n=1 Tax=Exobacillus caeni TaxID=2574798 RepID=A0A5R9F957_9BACL|nr:tRNA pseudouridine(55) synthase TruB [Pseudalkalibacillus caeni]TLS37373.1 tRNA pseudouridine(55) synthase TruB [Pseudalkalibacillus caeni]
MALQTNGILPLFKPAGMTSHDCVYKIRKLLKTKKVGHTGTLDPDVTGVLPICIGKATKVAQYMSDYPKTYIAEVTLGTATYTEDASGETVERKTVHTAPSITEIKEVLSEFKGKITQIPPMYSAVKVNGKRLYEYAFEGKVIDRPERQVTIHEIELIDGVEHNGETASFSIYVKCSKGTYVRTLAVDIGRKLGYPAHMSYLRRTASGPFEEEDCLTFEEITKKIEIGDSFLYPIEKALGHFEPYMVDKDIIPKIKNGAVLPFPEGVLNDRFTIKDEAGKVIAIYQRHPNKPELMKPVKVF